MAATSAATFSIGTNCSLGHKAAAFQQSKPCALKFNSQNPLKSSFNGLKATTSFNSETETSFSGKETASVRRASFARKAHKEEQVAQSQFQPQVSYKIAVLGAAGGIGQPLALLIKMSPLVSSLHLYDIANVKGVAADLSHCNTPSEVIDFTGFSPTQHANSPNGSPALQRSLTSTAANKMKKALGLKSPGSGSKKSPGSAGIPAKK